MRHFQNRETIHTRSFNPLQQIEWNGYIFLVARDDFDTSILHFRLIDPNAGHTTPVFHLQLAPLWLRDGAYEQGDYFQETMRKETMVPVNKKVSYAALTHDFLLFHRQRFGHIKRIYSSSTKGHPKEPSLPSVFTIRFWEKQLQKGLGVIFNGDRYMLPVNVCELKKQA
jgi:hypothetical protein